MPAVTPTSLPAPADARLRTAIRWGLAIVVTHAAFDARRAGLMPSSVWFDDAWVALTSRLPWSDVPTIGITSPGFTGLVKLTSAPFGNRSIGFQLAPVTFSVTLAPFLVVAFRRWLGLPLAVLGGFLAAWSPTAVEYAVRVKQYSFDSLAAAVLIWLGWSALDHLDEPRWRRLLLLVGVVALGMSAMTIVVSAPILSFVSIVAASRAPSPRAAGRRMVEAVALGGVSLAYWVLWLGRQSSDPTLRRYWRDFYVVTDDGITKTLSSLGSLLRDALTAQIGHDNDVVVVGMVALAVLATFRRPLLASVLWGPVACSMLLALAHRGPLGGGRTDSHLLPSFILLVTLGLAALFDDSAALFGPRREHAVPVLASVTAAVAIGSAFITRPPDPRYPLQDVRQAVEIIESERVDGEPIVVYYTTPWAYAIYSHDEVSIATSNDDLGVSLYPLAFSNPDIIVMGSRRAVPEEYEQWIQEATATRRRVWFVASHSNKEEVELIYEFFARHGYERERNRTDRGVRFTVWVPIVDG